MVPTTQHVPDFVSIKSIYRKWLKIHNTQLCKGSRGRKKVFFCLGISIICPNEYIHLSQRQKNTDTHTHTRHWHTAPALISVNEITSHHNISFWHNSQPWNKLIGQHIYLGGDQRSCWGSALSSKNLLFRLKRILLLSICQLLPSDSHCRCFLYLNCSHTFVAATNLSNY